MGALLAVAESTPSISGERIAKESANKLSDSFSKSLPNLSDSSISLLSASLSLATEPAATAGRSDEAIVGRPMVEK